MAEKGPALALGVVRALVRMEGRKVLVQRGLEDGNIKVETRMRELGAPGRRQGPNVLVTVLERMAKAQNVSIFHLNRLMKHGLDIFSSQLPFKWSLLLVY